MFIKFSLMPYLREIEEGVSALLPRGQESRFNVNAFLRPTTKARYEAHAIALDAGFLTANEVRELEGLQPVPGGDVLEPKERITDE